jgi:hypothetical protein
MRAGSGGARPSSQFALRVALLTVLLAPCVAPAEETAPPPAFKPGMSWTYRQRDEISGRDAGGVRLEVIAVAPERLTVSLAVPGEPAVNEHWDAVGNWEEVGTQRWPWLAQLGGATKRVAFVPALPLYRFPLAAGKSWVETVDAVDPDTGRKTVVKIFAKALVWEDVAVPAGKFRALKVRRSIAPEDAAATRSHTTITLIDWYAPQVDGTVKRISDWEYHDYRRPSGDQLTRGPRLRLELTAFTPPR